MLGLQSFQTEQERARERGDSPRRTGSRYRADEDDHSSFLHGAAKAPAGPIESVDLIEEIGACVRTCARSRSLSGRSATHGRDSRESSTGSCSLCDQMRDRRLAGTGRAPKDRGPKLVSLYERAKRGSGSDDDCCPMISSRFAGACEQPAGPLVPACPRVRRRAIPLLHGRAVSFLFFSISLKPRSRN